MVISEDYLLSPSWKRESATVMDTGLSEVTITDTTYPVFLAFVSYTLIPPPTTPTSLVCRQLPILLPFDNSVQAGYKYAKGGKGKTPILLGLLA